MLKHFPERRRMKNSIFLASFKEIHFMGTLMSLAATIIFRHPGEEFFAAWFKAKAKDFTMAFFQQIFFAGSLVRAIFGLIFINNKSGKQVPESTLHFTDFLI